MQIIFIHDLKVIVLTVLHMNMPLYTFNYIYLNM